MTTVLPADQAVRQRLLAELETTFFVEAGAGTGKTTALVSRIVELVARDGLQMERLAAITFTEAAAAELRDRVRQDLERAAIGRDGAAEQECCARASRQVDLAAVQTIHAFAGALLRRESVAAAIATSCAASWTSVADAPAATTSSPFDLLDIELHGGDAVA